MNCQFFSVFGELFLMKYSWLAIHWKFVSQCQTSYKSRLIKQDMLVLIYTFCLFLPPIMLSIMIEFRLYYNVIQYTTEQTWGSIPFCQFQTKFHQINSINKLSISNHPITIAIMLFLYDFHTKKRYRFYSSSDISSVLFVVGVLAPTSRL